MSKRGKIWARKARAQLIRFYGSRCRVCGATDFLEFDCIRPTGDRHHRFDTERRICFYRRQAAFGNLQLLCQKCNAIKSDKDFAEVFGPLFVQMLPELPASQLTPF